MSIVIPTEDEKKRLPYQVLQEINIILDESKPLPQRAALLLKWLTFFHALQPTLKPPSIEELDPETIRKLAAKLTRLIAEKYNF